MALTDTQVRNARPGPRPLKLFDGGGLFLLIAPAGGKWWRLKYRFGGKEKLLSLGTYPDTPLKDARERRDAARKLLAAKVDPGAARKAEKVAQAHQSASTFEAVAREWFGKFSPRWAPGHARTVIRRLERDLFPWLGDRPVGEINAPELLAAIRRIENRGALETAHRVLQVAGQVFRYAVASGRSERDPSGDLRGALPPVAVAHHAALTKPEDIGALLRAQDGYKGTVITKCALRVAPLVFVRPGELRGAEWAEFDLDGPSPIWTIPGAKMKTRQDHVVPLARQAVAILRELHPLTGHGRFLFPSERTPDRCMSENTLLGALRRLGYSKDEMTPHGWRAVARTMLDEVLGFRVDLIEHQLAHAVRDPLGRAYNRTAHLPERRKMMQAWADYLDGLAADKKILVGRFGQAR